MSDNLSDKDLYKLCQKYGAKILEARRKFSGLLPEVYKRRLYAKKGFGSIFEFAAKLAGMNKDQVNIVLRLNQRFEDKVLLKKALVESDVSINKLARIVSVATKENQAELLEKTKVLPSRALEVFVKDFKNQNRSLHVQTLIKSNNLQLDKDVEKELFELQEKGIDVNNFLRDCLKKRRLEIAQEKEKLSKNAKQTDSRYISIKVQRIIQKEYGCKCSLPGCNKPAVVFHHSKRFSIDKTHNPKYLTPLCKEHHQIAHAGLVKNEEMAPEFWKLRERRDKNNFKYLVDRKVVKYFKPKIL